MALAVAIEWLRDPLKHIQGITSIVSSFVFEFEGVQLRQLPRRSDCTIHCLTELTDGWAVGDGFGDVSVFDPNAEHCLFVVRHAYPVYTIAALDDNHFASNGDRGFWVVQMPTAHHVTFKNENHADYNHCILKLVAFPHGIVVSTTKCGPWIHVWDTRRQGTDCYMHTMVGSGTVADIGACGACGNRLVSVHKKVEATAWVWDVETGAHLQTVALNFRYFKSCAALDERTMCFYVVGGFSVFDVKTWTMLFEQTMDVFAWTTFDSQIMCSSLRDDTLSMLDVNTGALRILSSQNIKALQTSQVDRLLYIRSGHVVASMEGKLFVWR